jgi:hypothetical protein
MWQVKVCCSGCPEEIELTVEDLDEIDRLSCECGHGWVVISVASFEPVHAAPGELIELRPRRARRLAA